MKHVMTMLAVTAAVGLASTGYAASDSGEVKSSVEYKKDGGYSSTRKTEQTSSGGTTVSSESEVDVDVDSKGAIDKDIKNEHSTDPKGLMNKKEDTSESKIEEKERGGYKQTTTRKHADANGTDVVYTTTTDVDVDNGGNVTTKATTEKTVDPKGLMNKKTTSTTTKSVNGRVVEQEKK